MLQILAPLSLSYTPIFFLKEVSFFSQDTIVLAVLIDTKEKCTQKVLDHYKALGVARSDYLTRRQKVSMSTSVATL